MERLNSFSAERTNGIRRWVTNLVSRKLVAPETEVERKLQKTMSFAITFDEKTGLAYFKHRVWIFFEEPNSSLGASVYAIFMVLCIVGSLLCGMILSIDEFEQDYTILRIDLIIDITFLAEVVIRFLSCPSYMRFWFNLYNVIDFLSIVPLVATLLIAPKTLTTGKLAEEFRVLSFIRVVRPTLRLLKIARHFDGFRVLIRAFSISMEALPVAFFLLVVIVTTAGSLLFWVEELEGKSARINSIPKACWFALVTVSTVGYGDTVPETTAGKVICCGLIISGVMYMAMPLSIIGSNFTDVWKTRDLFLVLEKTRSRLSAQGMSRDELKTLIERSGQTDPVSGLPVINVAAFKSFLRDIQINISDDRIREVFNVFDIDKDGVLKAEMFTRFVFPGEKIRQQEIGDAPEDDDVSSPQQEPGKYSAIFTGRTIHSKITPIANPPAELQKQQLDLAAKVDSLQSNLALVSEQVAAANDRMSILVHLIQDLHPCVHARSSNNLNMSVYQKASFVAD